MLKQYGVLVDRSDDSNNGTRYFADVFAHASYFIGCRYRGYRKDLLKPSINNQHKQTSNGRDRFFILHLHTFSTSALVPLIRVLYDVTMTQKADAFPPGLEPWRVAVSSALRKDSPLCGLLHIHVSRQRHTTSYTAARWLAVHFHRRQTGWPPRGLVPSAGAAGDQGRLSNVSAGVQERQDETWRRRSRRHEDAQRRPGLPTLRNQPACPVCRRPSPRWGPWAGGTASAVSRSSSSSPASPVSACPAPFLSRYTVRLDSGPGQRDSWAD